MTNFFVQDGQIFLFNISFLFPSGPVSQTLELIPTFGLYREITRSPMKSLMNMCSQLLNCIKQNYFYMAGGGSILVYLSKRKIDEDIENELQYFPSTWLRYVAIFAIFDTEMSNIPIIASHSLIIHARSRN